MIPGRALILATLVLAGCQPKLATMTEPETTQMKLLTESMQPRCVGRYLIDLPKDFVINPISQTTIEGVTLQVDPMERSLFDTLFASRRKYLQEKLLPGKLVGRPHLRAVLPLLNDEPGGVFDRSESEIETSRMSRTQELWVWRDGYKIEAKVNATDTTFPEDANDALAQQLQTDTSERLSRLLQVVSRTQGRADLQIPAEQGVCFRYGFVKGSATSHEWVDLNYHFAPAEDVYFSFHSLSDIGPQSTTLLERGASIEEALARVNGRTLQKGKRQGGGIALEEWLTERQSDPGIKDYHFTLELNSKEGNANAPLIVGDFSSGVRRPQSALGLEEAAVLKPIQKATFAEAESKAIWDAVVSTLRPRPGAF